MLISQSQEIKDSRFSWAVLIIAVLLVYRSQNQDPSRFRSVIIVAVVLFVLTLLPKLYSYLFGFSGYVTGGILRDIWVFLMFLAKSLKQVRFNKVFDGFRDLRIDAYANMRGITERGFSIWMNLLSFLVRRLRQVKLSKAAIRFRDISIYKYVIIVGFLTWFLFGDYLRHLRIDEVNFFVLGFAYILAVLLVDGMFQTSKSSDSDRLSTPGGVYGFVVSLFSDFGVKVRLILLLLPVIFVIISVYTNGAPSSDFYGGTLFVFISSELLLQVYSNIVS